MTTINDTTKSITLEDRDIHSVEVGDSKDSSCFYPQAKVMQWGNETNFSVRLLEDPVDGTYEEIKNTDCLLYTSPSPRD